MTYTMEDFRNDYADCKAQLENLGYHLQDNIPLVFNNRAVTRYGQCTVYRNNCTGESKVRKIELSTKPFAYSSREEIKNTVMHECIHALPECHFVGHKGNWVRIANEVNNKYGYNISRCSSREDKEGLAQAKAQVTRYIVKCEKCGHEWNYQKFSNCVKHPEHYTHNKCGGHLVRVK